MFLNGCICNISKKLAERKGEDRTIQFLLGLNENFIDVREQVLSSGEMLNLGKVYAIVSQKDKRRSINKRKTGESTTFYSQSKNKKYNEGETYEAAKEDKPYFMYSRTGKMLNMDVYCEHCKRYGHVKDTCYKIHGYPNPQKGREG